MTSALLFVALLVVVDVSYRRWMRRSIGRYREARRADRVIVLDPQDALVIPMRARRGSPHDQGRSR